jgi:hypothetical protein
LLKKIAKKIPLVTYAEIDSISCRSWPLFEKSLQLCDPDLYM